jgi:DNA-directed RNA polymerase subunit RPC12/RpoP
MSGKSLLQVVRRPSVWFWLAVVAFVLLWSADGWARPGGGQTYSRPGGRPGGGGGGGDGDAIGLILFLLIEHPTIGVPVAIIAVVVWAVGQRRERTTTDWSTAAPSSPMPAAGRPGKSLRTRLVEVVRANDPNFSLVLFEDFAYSLFAKAHELRARDRLEALSPYLTAEVREGLAYGADHLSRVYGIVIGDMKVVQVLPAQAGTGAQVQVALSFEANFTEVSDDGKEQAFWVVERWRLGRSTSAQTRPPDQLTVEGCPNCGATLETHGREGRCTYCDTRVDTGAFDWVVDQVHTLGRQRRGPQLTGTVPERGTHLPTVRAPDLPARLQTIRAKDPAFDPGEGLRRRVELVFRKLNRAWTTKRWTDARPYVSDALFQTQLYWIETYKAQGLTNMLEDFRILHTEVAAAVSDRWFDSITVRLWATGKDYTIRDADGAVVGGEARQERKFSEYWTFIRRSETRGPARSDENCPSCGAGLQIEMAGTCSYCGSKITSGEFDWVLSKIEQDEAYRG